LPAALHGVNQQWLDLAPCALGLREAEEFRFVVFWFHEFYSFSGQVYCHALRGAFPAERLSPAGACGRRVRAVLQARIEPSIPDARRKDGTTQRASAGIRNAGRLAMFELRACPGSSTPPN
jgi:hypothetical protein